MQKAIRNIFLIIALLAVAFPFGACREEDWVVSDKEEAPDSPFGKDVYTLGFTVTVDNMGGDATRAASISLSEPDFVTRNENYIDLERFRVMFFDNNDKFLFESKNRWVRQVDENDQFSSWYVSIPFGAFGNDSYGEGLEYDWDGIREYITHNEFKIAIMANRPAQLLYPGFMESTLELPEGVFDNDGPYWGPKDVGKRDIFELHHFQYDIIYTDKSDWATATNSYYDFVMGEINTNRPTMGAAINWVSFDNKDTDKELINGSTYARNLKMPGKDHPIPMYGVQKFSPIPESAWSPGSAFDLSDTPKDAYPNPSGYTPKTISLLRSCVRLDLLIPKSIKGGQAPSVVTLWYSNIYSRTEPMDNWSPTDELWVANHDAGCEWESILNYGGFGHSTNNSKLTYQQKLSWYYGIWKNKGWQFKTRQNTYITPTAPTANTPYPRIYNTCIQRNKVIRCNRGDYTQYYNDNYHHFIVYTGERNPTDPNTLPNMTKNNYFACFIISWDKSKYYAIPLLNYAKNNDSSSSRANVFGPHTDGVYANGSWPAALNTYMGDLIGKTGNNLPYPLLRNHIYRFTLTGTKGAEDELENISVQSDVLQSGSINFTPQVVRAKAQQLNTTPVKK